MSKELLSKFCCGDILIQYIIDNSSGKIEFNMIPTELECLVDYQKQYNLDSLIQIKIIGDDYPNGFAHGVTMRNSMTTLNLKYHCQTCEEKDDCRIIKTILVDSRGYLLEHKVIWYFGYSALEIITSFKNTSESKVSIELLSSFSVGGITPFEEDDASNSLILHRIRSVWSSEGRLESIPVEDIQLEPSWSLYGVRCERFGQIGSMPVRKYFPFAAIEDKKRNVCWGVQLACASSWQLEVYRNDNSICLSGGLADREFGHWVKDVLPGEKFTTPTSIVSVSQGDIDLLCQRLTQFHNKALLEQNIKVEEELPVVFNEFCTTWGNPTYENIYKIANCIKNKGIKYLVIDCGWYKASNRNWDCSMGDWDISSEMFPGGLENAVEIIKSCGMIPGIWFEIEVAGRDSDSFNNTEHQLKRDGVPITTGNRRFWDMEDPYVINYLTKKVIDLIKKYGFGYLKIDYNDNIGIGCDGSESLGEGLRKKIIASQEFIKKIKREVPNIVIENCSSGGHRLEPSMMSITSMTSFSDAHECNEIPIIAANLHRTTLPRQNQIWAVFRKEDSSRRLIYSLISTFLGRMCLSGDIYNLDENQWDIIDKGIAFYKKISPIIKEGNTQFFGNRIKSYRNPEGFQGILRTSNDGNKAIMIIHTFKNNVEEGISMTLPDNFSLSIHSIFGEKGINAKIIDGRLQCNLNKSFQAACIYMEKSEIR